MILLIVYLLSVFCVLGVGVLAGWSDFKGLTIPNIYHGFIIGAFVAAAAAVYLSGAGIMGPLWPHIAVAAVVLVVTFVMYSLRVFGGGDSKLLSAYALWTGLVGILPMIFYMALTGGLLGLVTIFIRKKKPFRTPREGSWIARVQAGENRVPYGIPIGIGALIAFFQIGYLSPDSFSLFLNGGE